MTGYSDAPVLPAQYPVRGEWFRKARDLFSGRGLIGLVVTLIVLWLVAVPLVFLIFTSFRDTRRSLPFEAQTQWTLHNYEVMLTSLQTYRVLGLTAMFAIGAALVALVIVVTFAYLIERTDLRFRRSILTLILTPMAMPPFVAGMAWVLLCNPRTGLLNTTLRNVLGLEGPEGPINIFSLPGMIVVAGLLFVPSMYLMVSGTFGNMDPSLEEASRVGGVGRWGTIFRITFPVLLPGIAAAMVYFLVGGFEVFEIPALLGLPGRQYTLSTFTVLFLDDPSSTLPNYGQAAAYGVLTVAVVAVLMVFYWRVVQRRKSQFATITGRGFHRQRMELGRWNYVALGVAGLYCLLAFALPIAVLAWRSLLPPFAPITSTALTFAMYERMLSSPAIRDAALNSLIISFVTAVAGMFLSTVVAWLSVRAKSRWGELADQLAFLSMGLPGVIIALAAILMYLFIPLPIYGTIWIIVIALVTRYLAFGVRVMNAALLQVKTELEEASWMGGVSHLSTLWRIVIPLVRPSVSRGFLWMFVHAFRDATVVIVLASAANGTLAIEIWLTWFEAGNLSYAAALSMPVAIVSIILTLFIAREYSEPKSKSVTVARQVAEAE